MSLQGWRASTLRAKRPSAWPLSARAAAHNSSIPTCNLPGDDVVVACRQARLAAQATAEAIGQQFNIGLSDLQTRILKSVAPYTRSGRAIEHTEANCQHAHDTIARKPGRNAGEDDYTRMDCQKLKQGLPGGGALVAPHGVNAIEK